jgi:hypothetical protein
MIEDCERRQEKLNDWEQQFIQSLGKQIGKGKSLTSKQLDKLEVIPEMEDRVRSFKVLGRTKINIRQHPCCCDENTW